MKVDALTPVLRAAPGERARCRLRIENDDPGPLSYGLRVVGFDENHVLRPPPNGPLAAGTSEEVELEFLIPDAFAAGHHSIAVEVTPARPGSPPVIAGVTVSVGQIDDVAMAVVPSTVRGRRRGKFRLDLDNRSRNTIDVELGGEGPDLRVSLRPDRVELRPGDRVRTSGKVKGPRHLVGDPLQHSFTVTARSRSAPSYAPGTFHQRPLLPRSLRTLLVALLLLGIWGGALGAGVYWWMERDEGGPTANLVQLVDTDGDGVADTPADQLVDTDGDGVPDTPASVVAAEVAAGGGGEPQAGGSGLPTRTVIGGTVKAGETGDDSDVRVTLTPIDLAATPATGLAGPAGQSRPVSVGPEQAPPPQPSDQPGVSAARQTVSVESTATGPDGAWLFADVPIRQTYELNFALEGFDSQSFVITPPDDGSPVEMEVVLEPASGALSGSVVGPGGPLGNVDLVLTDGELTFNTTTASAGDVGTWSLSGVSTPGTYTLTATLRGYGTEVLQITLEPGEQRSGVTISMVPDVGSIIGRISADGNPLGGVTLTASRGDDSRTTTSLTEGDTGLYSFPRLATPGRYTVTASRDGYMTQTRLVTLGGNVTGVDFNLVRTTATIRGVVTSVGRGGHERGPLPSAAITVSRDELSFDTESASPPDKNVGSFVITDLPPGTYLVEFSRFDHRPASQIVTVAAGEVKDLGKVPLRFAPRRGVDQLGSLEVRVVDEGGDPLLGSTVTVRDVATGEVVASMSDEGADRQSTFVFDPLDVGTYEVTGTKPQFKPRTARVSIGPERRESVQLILFEQGQATGRIVDSLSDPDDRTPLTGYFVTIHTVLSNGDRGPAFLPPISPNPPDDDGNIVWETPPRSLPIGRYEVVVTQPPPGYRVRPDQVLMDGLPPMRFDILPEGQDVLVLADIEADPLPELSGRVLAPRLGAPNAVSFVRINSDTLTVGLTCAGGPGRSEGRADLDGLPGFDAFEFPKETVGQAIGSADGADCTLRFEATGYVPVVVTVRIDPSDGLRNPDITRNVAMFKPTDVGGRAYWVDHGNGDMQMPAPAIGITSIGPVITGFNPSTGADDPRFVVSDGPVQTATDADGLWRFVEPDKQVFGRATYEFSEPAANYDDRQVAITIDEDGRSVAPVDPPDGLELDDSIAVELDAHGGDIDGEIMIRSTTPDFTGFVMELTGADSLTANAKQVGTDPRNGVAQARTTDPGTYQAAITIPEHHRPLPASAPQSGIPVFQNPGEDLVAPNPAFRRVYVELGRIDVTVEDGLGELVSGATVTLERVPSTGPIASQPTVAGQVTFEDLPVNTVNPEGLPVTYVARVTNAPGYDLTDAAVAVPVVAGAAPAVTITIEEFGSITGNVVGQVPGQPQAPLPVSEVTITAQRRFLLDGTPLPALDPALPVEPVGTNGFSISGPPGFYTIDVSHPAYDPLSVPPPDAVLNDGTADFPVFRMANITPSDPNPNDAGQWVLQAKPGTLDLTVHRNTLTGAGVGLATVTLTGPNAFSFTGQTDANGRLVVPGLPQGDYELTIREVAGGDDQSFPVIVTVNIPFGTSDAARTRVVDAPLPQIGGELTGPIQAVNLEGDRVPVPAVTVTREYTPPQVQVGSDLADNTATEDDLVRAPGTGPQPTATVAASADGTPTRYLFEHLPTGAHVLSFSDAVGYSTPGDVTESVESIVDATEVDPVEYTAADRTVIVSVTTGGAPVNDATVTLTQTDPDDLDEDVLTAGVGGAYTFVAVAPEVTAYTVTVEKPLHTTQTRTVVVPPGDPATAIEVPVIELPADRAFIRGIAQKRQSASSTVPMANEGTVSLIEVTSGEVVASVVPGGDGSYQFERTTAGSYRVRVELNGFATRESAQFTAPLGVTTNVPNVVVPALATANVTVNGPAAGAPMSVVITAPASQTGVAPSRTGRVFTFRLDPGTNPGNGHAYQFQASSPGFVTATVPGGPFTLAPGAVVNPSVTLDERSLGGTVTPAANNTRVELRNDQGQTVDFTTTNGSGVYEFDGVDAGTWTIVSERFGTGRGSITRTISATTGDVTGANITLAARNVNVAFTVTPTNATVELLSGGNVIDSVPPLVATERQLPLTWRASAAGFVTETGNVPAPSQAGSFDATSFAVTIPPITLDPEPPPTT